jgi:hypothetical protein
MLSARIPTVVAAVVSTVWLSSAAVAENSDSAKLPITRVTLYTSGVGYFERDGMVDGDANETLLFPVDQVNDVLKSMVLLDTGGGTIEPVTYAAQDPLQKQLSGFSVDLGDNPSRAALLNRLRGADATVVAGTQTITGTIVGVETKTVTLPNNGGTTNEDILNLMAQDGLHSIPLDTVSTISLTDPALNDELRQALSVVAHGRDASKRPVKLSFSGHGRRNVMVGYLTPAPLWQTTYRLVLGSKPVMQGWALVQNTSQDDWNGVSLNLVSGRPISFIQDLYTPIYVTRPVVQARVAEGATPQTYNSNIAADQLTESAPAGAVAALPAPAPVGGGSFNGNEYFGVMNGPVAKAPSRTYRLEPRQAVQTALNSAGAKLGETLFSYEIKVPVSVPRQQSAMIPFVSSGIDAQAVSIYNAGVQADHPLAGARLKNTTGLHLMGGPLTVFDEGSGGTSYVGDALIDDTEPGQTRLISYAVDLAVDGSKEDDAAQASESIVIDRGVLQVTNNELYKTTYTFKNHADKPRTVVVESPYRGDEYKLVDTPKPSEHTAEYDRFDVAVPAGQSKTLVVKEQHPELTVYGLIDADLGTLVAYVTNGEASPAVKDALRDVIERRRKIADLQKEIDGHSAELNAIAQGQERIRNNMKALDHTSALYKRYVGELNDQETKIESIHAEIDRLTHERDEAQADLSAHVSNLNVQ